jgi:maleylpyruvate isomerase
VVRCMRRPQRIQWSSGTCGSGKFICVTTDPLALSHEVDRATQRFLDSAADLTDASLAEPSLLPGWTRAHVMAHVARNADSLINLLNWARTGVETRQYASPDEREAGIAAGAKLPIAELRTDVRQASERFAQACADMPADAWAAVLDDAGPAAKVVWRRLREVEVHHVDLAAGYTWRDWPEAFSHRLLHDLIGVLRGGEPPAAWLKADELSHPLQLGSGSPDMTVRGRAADLAAWLAGRSDGVGLTVDPVGDLPVVPAWM